MGSGCGEVGFGLAADVANHTVYDVEVGLETGWIVCRYVKTAQAFLKTSTEPLRG